jgi:hypothetical protein
MKATRQPLGSHTSRWGIRFWRPAGQRRSRCQQHSVWEDPKRPLSRSTAQTYIAIAGNSARYFRRRCLRRPLFCYWQGYNGSDLTYVTREWSERRHRRRHLCRHWGCHGRCGLRVASCTSFQNGWSEVQKTRAAAGGGCCLYVGAGSDVRRRRCEVNPPLKCRRGRELRVLTRLHPGTTDRTTAAQPQPRGSGVLPYTICQPHAIAICAMR